MNCYEHTDTVSVATCACGRGLCGSCQGRYQPPTCGPCHTASVATRIEKTQQRLTVNCIFAVAYVIVGLLWLTGAQIHNLVTDVAVLMVGVWGFLGFRWLLDGALGVTRLAIFASAQSWFIAYILGSICCSVGGFVLVPYQIVTQRRLLKQLKAEAGAAPAEATLGAAA